MYGKQLNHLLKKCSVTPAYTYCDLTWSPDHAARVCKKMHQKLVGGNQLQGNDQSTPPTTDSCEIMNV